MDKDYTKQFQIEIIKKHMLVAGISVVILLMFYFFLDNFYNGAVIDFIQDIFGHNFANFILRNQSLVVFITILVVLLINFLVVEVYALQKISGVFSQMRILFKKDDQSITLDSSLKELEDDFNALKKQSIENEKKVVQETQRKVDMIAYLAHDIKTPLASVIGYLCLLEETDALPEDTRKKYTHLTLEKAYRLETLINEFFDIAKLNQTYSPLQKEDIHLFYLLEQMKDEFYPLLKKKKKDLIIEVENDVMIYADSHKIARVFNNLIKNALSYGDDETSIIVRAHCDKNYTHIFFQNTGPTIPKEKIKDIFEQFYRLDESRSTSTGGSGLGLSIAKTIVDQHGGHIQVRSDNKLTIFEVILPNYKS